VNPRQAARDAALETLLLPFAESQVDWPADPSRVLFLHARADAALPEAARGWTCEQTFRPHADALLARGLQVVPTVEHGAFARVLALPPRQREQARGVLAHAASRIADGGVVVAAQRNDEGARTMQDDLARLVGPVQALSKHHCRVAWARVEAARVDRALVAAWLADDAPRTVEATGLASRPGVFSWDRIDPGSALLAACLPDDLAGRVADFGAGIGVLSLTLLRTCPQLASLDLYEADARALALARANIDAGDPDIPVDYHWHDVARGVPARYDAIVCNPPFHAGRDADPTLGQAFLRAAADALVEGGRLWLVANRHLPYEATLGAGFGDVRCVREAEGFKVIEARKRAAPASPPTAPAAHPRRRGARA
jgi:16S rRNA (guanine1207-N2)-methyltransferase